VGEGSDYVSTCSQIEHEQLWVDQCSFWWLRQGVTFDVLLTVHLSIFISVINQLDAQNFCFTISFFSCLHVSSTCAHHQEVKIALYSLWYHHTYRGDDTRGCVMQFWPPDDEHMCLKHVEAWNKLIVKQKFCASSWLITDINKGVTCFYIHLMAVIWGSAGKGSYIDYICSRTTKPLFSSLWTELEWLVTYTQNKEVMGFIIHHQKHIT